MNCDHAFELMTDPALDDCAELQSHLDECSRCRQMYETLSPALGLFASAGPGVERSAADDTTAAGGLEIAERVAVRLAQAPRTGAPAVRSRPAVRTWACVLAGGLVLVSAIGLSALRSGAPVAPSAAERCTWQNRQAVPANPRAEAVVLSCVACHAAQQTLQQEAARSLPLSWTDWTVPALVEGDAMLPFDDLAWLQWAVWPTERTAHS